MKKVICSVGLLACWLVAGALSVSAAEERIVFADMERLFGEFYKTKIAEAKLKERAEDFTDERRALVAEVKKMEEEFNAIRDEAQDTALNEDAKEQKRKRGHDKEAQEQQHCNHFFDYDFMLRILERPV